MKKLVQVFTFALLGFSPILLAQPVKIIFDTDMGNDVDDALALAQLHSHQNREEIELLAITVTKDHEEVAPYIDAINTFYGRGDIPIGINHRGITPQQSRFTGVAQEREGDQLAYPHDLRIGDSVPTATEVLRQSLAAQPDNSVTIVQVGFSTNLAALLDSPADEFSALTGKELVAQKVSSISIMAGAFELLNGNVHREFNIVMDIPAAQKLAEEWPTPIYWSGFEIGLAIRYPAASIDNDFQYVQRHPVQESYQAYIPTPHARPTFDLTSVLLAARPERDYFGLSEPGKVSIKDNGESEFTADAEGNHYYLTVEEGDINRIAELMAALVSEPPQLSPR